MNPVTNISASIGEKVLGIQNAQNNLSESDHDMAELVEQAYKPPDERVEEMNGWKIVPEYTTDFTVVYEDADGNKYLGVRGTKNKADIVPDAEIMLTGETDNEMVDDNRIKIDKCIPLELNPGSFSLHDVNLIHGSSPNTSGKRRSGVAIRYMPGTSYFDRELMKTGKNRKAVA